MNPMTDKFDLLILAELQQDARLPTTELAHRVGLSAPACYRRVRALRESGLIEREVALVAPSTMGWPITMLVLVTLERDHGRIVDEVEALVAMGMPVSEALDAASAAARRWPADRRGRALPRRCPGDRAGRHARLCDRRPRLLA